MVIVSHDRELLGLVDQVADLSGGQIRTYGGNLDAYEALLAAEQAAAERAVTTAAAKVRRERRDLVEAQVKQARRDRMGRQLAASGSIPRIVAHARKRAAQETAGRSRELHSERLQAARDRLDEAEQAVRDDAEIRVDLPGTAVPAGRTVLSVTGLDGSHWHPAAALADAASAAAFADAAPATVSIPPPRWQTSPPRRADPGPPVKALAELIVRGPERIALTGPNGSGKTTLLRAIAGLAARPGVTVRLGAVVGYLPQRLDILDDSLSVVDNVRAAAPAASVNGSGPAWPGSCSAARGPNAWPACCPAASASAPCSPPCCSRSPRPSCCCSTSRPTTWTWPRSGSCRRPWRAIAARSWWRATTCRSCVRPG